MKYVILESHTGLELPFIFPSNYGHSEFAALIPHVKVVSAGECKISDDIECSFFVSKQGSISLNIPYNEERYKMDGKILKNHLTNY